jgi:hypothetical protein
MVFAVGVFFLGSLATSEVYILSLPPPANGLWFGIGLTGWQVTVYAWVSVALFAAGFACLLFLSLRYFAASAPPPLPSRTLSSSSVPPAGRRRRKWTARNGLRATLVAVGALLLVGLVFTGAVGQVGVRECCSGSNCGPEPGVCSYSTTGLWLIVAMLAGSAGLVAVGLTGAPGPRSSGSDPEPSVRKLALLGPSLAGCFLVPLGSGFVTLGLLLPWNIFGFCPGAPEGTPIGPFGSACSYPYDLAGYPLDLVVAGALLLSVGAILLAFVGIRYGKRSRDQGRVGSGRWHPTD